MITKTVSLKDCSAQEVVGALTRGFDFVSTNFPCIISFHDLSLNGVVLQQQEMIKLVENLRDNLSYSVVRGHIKVDGANVTYSDVKYFGYERMDTTISMSNMTLAINKFDSFKFYVSENNWIDLHFMKNDGSYVTMVIVP